MFKLNTQYKKILADTITPVSIYLKLRDKYPNSLLLESSDYHASDNSFSYICSNPIASFKVEGDVITENLPDGSVNSTKIDASVSVPEAIQKFSKRFKTDTSDFKFINNGIFGYIAYDAVRYFENVEVKRKEKDLQIPDVYYAVYQNIIAINHFKNEAYLFDHSYDSESKLEEIEQLLKVKNFASYNFTRTEAPYSNLNDDEYRAVVDEAKEHCQRGDVFQLVLSRRFSQKFKGDEFNVYRALRNVNPSPYLFYFDYGNFKIFGSSPEAQLVVDHGRAEIHPIAGTFKRTGNDEKDAELAKELSVDQKENSEHVMLVDLARNDLSRNGSDVVVENYREIQFFSHVIHLVSKVTGKIDKDVATPQIVADTFPAGTLSGAPKPMALKLIEKFENVNRSAYGGAIGFMDFEGNFNHAIIIRSFVSKNHELHYQAGAGIVSGSKPENELQEVYNKLGALTKALEIAEEI